MSFVERSFAMTRWPTVFALALAGILVAVLSVQAQQNDGPPGGRRGGRGPGMGGPGGGLMILRLEKVQADLKLTDEQKEKLRGLGQEARGNRENLDKQLAEILKPEQLARLKEIRLQVDGAGALSRNPEVAKALELTDDQKEKLQALQTEAREKMRDAMQGGEDLTREARMAKMTEMRKEMQTKALAVLTPEQQKKFEKMQGAKIEIDFSALRPQGGRRGPANQN
jgi:Spy/CpxP family protein refolding chaperone